MFFDPPEWRYARPVRMPSQLSLQRSDPNPPPPSSLYKAQQRVLGAHCPIPNSKMSCSPDALWTPYSGACVTIPSVSFLFHFVNPAKGVTPIGTYHIGKFVTSQIPYTRVRKRQCDGAAVGFAVHLLARPSTQRSLKRPLGVRGARAEEESEVTYGNAEQNMPSSGPREEMLSFQRSPTPSVIVRSLPEVDIGGEILGGGLGLVEVRLTYNIHRVSLPDSYNCLRTLRRCRCRGVLFWLDLWEPVEVEVEVQVEAEVEAGVGVLCFVLEVWHIVGDCEAVLWCCHGEGYESEDGV